MSTKSTDKVASTSDSDDSFSVRSFSSIGSNEVYSSDENSRSYSRSSSSSSDSSRRRRPPAKTKIYRRKQQKRSANRSINSIERARGSPAVSQSPIASRTRHSSMARASFNESGSKLEDSTFHEKNLSGNAVSRRNLRSFSSSPRRNRKQPSQRGRRKDLYRRALFNSARKVLHERSQQKDNSRQSRKSSESQDRKVTLRNEKDLSRSRSESLSENSYKRNRSRGRRPAFSVSKESPKTILYNMQEPLLVKSRQSVNFNPAAGNVVVESVTTIAPEALSKSERRKKEPMSNFEPIIEDSKSLSGKGHLDENSDHQVLVGESMIVVKRISTLQRSDGDDLKGSTDSRLYRNICELQRGKRGRRQPLSIASMNGASIGEGIYNKSEILRIHFGGNVPEDFNKEDYDTVEAMDAFYDNEVPLNQNANVAVFTETMHSDENAIVLTRLASIKTTAEMWNRDEAIFSEQSRSYVFNSRSLSKVAEILPFSESSNESRYFTASDSSRMAESTSTNWNSSKSTVLAAKCGSGQKRQNVLPTRKVIKPIPLQLDSTLNASPFKKSQQTPQEAPEKSSYMHLTPGKLPNANRHIAAKNSQIVSLYEMDREIWKRQNDLSPKPIPPSAQRDQLNKTLDLSLKRYSTPNSLQHANNTLPVEATTGSNASSFHTANSSRNYQDEISLHTARSASNNNSKRESLYRSASSTPRTPARNLASQFSRSRSAEPSANRSTSPNPTVDLYRSKKMTIELPKPKKPVQNQYGTTFDVVLPPIDAPMKDARLNKTAPGRVANDHLTAEVDVIVESNEASCSTNKNLEFIASVNGTPFNFNVGLNFKHSDKNLVVHPRRIEFDGKKLWESTESWDPAPLSSSRSLATTHAVSSTYDGVRRT